MTRENPSPSGRVTTYPRPASPLSVELELNAQIHEAELAVIARDERVQKRLSAVRERLRRNSGFGLAGLGIVAVAAVLPGLLGGRSRPMAVADGGITASLLSQLFGRLWQAVPSILHAVVPSGIPGILIGWGLPLARQLLAPRKSCSTADGPPDVQARPPVTTGPEVDIERFLGRVEDHLKLTQWVSSG